MITRQRKLTKVQTWFAGFAVIVLTMAAGLTIGGVFFHEPFRGQQVGSLIAVLLLAVWFYRTRSTRA